MTGSEAVSKQILQAHVLFSSSVVAVVAVGGVLVVGS